MGAWAVADGKRLWYNLLQPCGMHYSEGDVDVQLQLKYITDTEFEVGWGCGRFLQDGWFLCGCILYVLVCVADVSHVLYVLCISYIAPAGCPCQAADSKYQLGQCCCAVP